MLLLGSYFESLTLYDDSLRNSLIAGVPVDINQHSKKTISYDEVRAIMDLYKITYSKIAMEDFLKDVFNLLSEYYDYIQTTLKKLRKKYLMYEKNVIMLYCMMPCLVLP